MTFISSRQINFDTDNDKDFGVITFPPYLRTTRSEQDIQRCVGDCRTLPQYDPVCGTDGVTYFNIYKLRCAQKCGKRKGRQKQKLNNAENLFTVFVSDVQQARIGVCNPVVDIPCGKK